jgi:hypothetical protein
VRECTLGASLLRCGFFAKLAIETAVECAIDLEEWLAEMLHAIIMNRKNNLRERVEVIIEEFALGISEVVGDLEEELEREFRGRHRGGGVGGVGGVVRKLDRSACCEQLARRGVA